jgi:hypothetical protein
MEQAPMTMDDHCIGVGKIVTNLQSLEFVMRIFLADAHEQAFTIPKNGDVSVPETFATNFLPLGDIITAYNASLSEAESAFRIDPKFIALRDSIAHGRLLTQIDAPLTLYKFGRPKSGSVPIESLEVLTEDWMKTNRRDLYDSIQLVTACGKKRNYRSFA